MEFFEGDPTFWHQLDNSFSSGNLNLILNDIIIENIRMI